MIETQKWEGRPNVVPTWFCSLGQIPPTNLITNHRLKVSRWTIAAAVCFNTQYYT